ncbi:sodium/calcium exchanger protein [Nocardioides euryhalodurans]|uniref:Sodium/calcium exchanger membrane region domain-containing protein n=1 Tax=Nocardioides euryhalodurans TaxID=2518370 RepID=A0A4P7GM98_9ACTN|nr:sodium/calcium exchanger protein [Nocardioides euryhalodurans]QBR93275.1 hypothetical protein EXE57_14145 [Nocardioides euryhalodurans]
MPEGSAGSTGWRRHLVIAGSCALLGVAVHLASPFLPVPLALIGLGVGLVGAGFMLAWAADAGEAVFSGGAVLAVIALVAILPEFVIEVRYAYIQEVGLVTANLTGATRLLLTGAAALPLLVLLVSRRRARQEAPLELAPHRRLDLGILIITAVFAVQIVVRGSLTVVDSAVLLALYVLFAMRVQGAADEEPAVVGVPAGLRSLSRENARGAVVGLILIAGCVVLVVANPFADALLVTGTSMGLDPYLLIQSVVPGATESPEFVIVAVLVANHRPAQGLALLLASSVSQWTVGLGLLPIAFAAGGGGTSMPLSGREQLELGFTIAVTLFVVAALATLRPERADASLILGVFLVQLIYPAPFVRFACGFVLLVFAIDLLCARRRTLRPMLRSAVGRRHPTPASPR